MEVPDALIVSIVGVLGGVLGFLAREVWDLRTRVTVLEHRVDVTGELKAKLDRLDEKLDALALKVAGTDALGAGAYRSNTAQPEGRAT